MSIQAAAQAERERRRRTQQHVISIPDPTLFIPQLTIEEPQGDGGDEFDTTPEDGPTRTQLGDLWQLGKHRLLVGDSTDPATLTAFLVGVTPTMIWADPPYGISIVKVSGSIGSGNMIPAGKYAPVVGDNSPTTAIAAYSLIADLYPAARHIWWGGNHYANMLPPSSCWIVWDKQNTGTDFADAELAWCSSKTAVRIFHHMWNGLMKASERGERRVHPTQKPVALAEWAFEFYGTPSDVVFDPFLGSGMSLIAAERTGRTCYGCEISPAYGDVILRRFTAETGIEPIKLDHNRNS